jgi:hypothetical protein
MIDQEKHHNKCRNKKLQHQFGDIEFGQFFGFFVHFKWKISAYKYNQAD